MKGKMTSPDLLNKREQEILQRLAVGLSDQQIADELFLSRNTIKWYNRQLYSKLGVTSRTQAIAYAKEIGLLEPGFSMSSQREATLHSSSSKAEVENNPGEPGLARQAGASNQNALPSTAPLWNIPYRRNPCFTGREDLLRQLRERFVRGEAVALTQPQALSGLGGIGKTQVAVEYAYRYRTHYQAIFWVRAASLDTLITDFTSIATLLCLPEQDAAEQATAVLAARRWLSQQSEWLLILDNADDLALVASFFPEEVTGHLLLTTRAQATGTLAFSCCVEPLDQQESCLLLLRRAKGLAGHASLDQAPSALVEQASRIAEELGGLPLALEQAGAYLEETGCSLSEYLEIFGRRRSELLSWRSPLSLEYPHSVASTWELSFRRIEQTSPAAANLLRLCAFLAPDAIPELLLGEGASALDPILSEALTDPLRLHEAIGVLRRYSFIRRDQEARTLTIHRLVQAILRENLEEADRLAWADRAVHLVAAAFPEPEFASWPVCQQYLPHALACATLIEEHHLAFPEAADLLHRAGSYAKERSLYTQAQPLLQQAMHLREQALGREHPHVAAVCNDLGYLYTLQGKYQQAEPLYQRALTIQEQMLISPHPDTATTLYNLAYLCLFQGKYQQAEPLYQRALAIREQALGREHPHVAAVCNDLGYLYTLQGKYQQAEPLYQRALAIKEHTLHPNDPELAATLYEVAYLCLLFGKYQQAESLYQRTLTIWEQTRGSEDRTVANIFYDLGRLHVLLGKYQQAEAFYQRALSIYEQICGTEHPGTALVLGTLADLYVTLGRSEEAEPLCQGALLICEQALSSDHPHTARILQTIARLCASRGFFEKAEAFYQRVLTIREQTLGMQHPETATTLVYQGQLYQAQGRDEEAEAFYQRALSIREQVLGREHPETIKLRAHYDERGNQRQQ